MLEIISGEVDPIGVFTSDGSRLQCLTNVMPRNSMFAILCWFEAPLEDHQAFGDRRNDHCGIHIFGCALVVVLIGLLRAVIVSRAFWIVRKGRLLVPGLLSSPSGER
jgi:hypothetical protein